MKATKNTTQIIEKEVKTETVNFLDRHPLHWFIDTKTNELRIEKSISDFLSNKTESYSVKTVHSCDAIYWKLAETTDGKFILLTRPKMMK
jgi:hypothetical protein